MSPPKVFAVQRSETDTFQLLQIEEDEKGLTLKNWNRPTLPSSLDKPSEEREVMLPWYLGQEWQILPTPKKGQEAHIHTLKIQDVEQHWWSLHHNLVWSNQKVHENRFGKYAEVWENSPCIPVLEFNNKHIYPSTETGFQVRWLDTKPSEIQKESSRGWDSLKVFMNFKVDQERFDTSTLRIRTPPSRNQDSSTSEDEVEARAPIWRTVLECSSPEGSVESRRLQSCIVSSLLMLMICLTLGSWVFSVALLQSGDY